MMVGNVRAELVPDPAPGSNGTTAVHGPVDFGYPVSPLMLTSAITFAVGLCQVINQQCWTNDQAKSFDQFIDQV
jgi:hypothetical protein